ncbi:phosphatidylinositol-specific phospholipase C1-like protein, partial [Caulobacter sp.]|uniref:phosphatidylinositol-specific phospholipase C1-like protein n=1 Tax=Caulobacter sp. TaxID=78 RepID=UPI002B496174
MTDRKRAFPCAVAGALALLTALSAAPSVNAAELSGRASKDLRLNDLQSVGTHNSYKTRIPPVEMAMIAKASPPQGRSLDYWHPTLTRQLDLGMRQIELDVAYDPEGGRYADPALARMTKDQPGAVPFDASQMSAPGFKVQHMTDVDVRASCPTFKSCLEEIRRWSKVHPDHIPLLIMLNAKDGEAYLPGGVKPLPYDEKAFDALDAEIRAVFPEGELITPDQVRGTHKTLREGAMAGGWPKLSRARGKVFFALDEHAPKVKLYLRGHTSLEGLPIFVNALDEAADYAAYFTLNDPIGQQDRIQAAVRAGFVVRTRADSDTAEARTNDTRRREAAFASGAQ